MENLLQSDWLILVAGYVLARWDRRGEQQNNQANVSTELQSRLHAAEDWIKQHSDIRVDFQALSSGLETVTKAIERLTERFDEWAAPPSRKRA
jgi:hypothetical protein